MVRSTCNSLQLKLSKTKEPEYYGIASYSAYYKIHHQICNPLKNKIPKDVDLAETFQCECKSESRENKKYHQDQIRVKLLKNFLFQEREEFSKNLWRYAFKIVERELSFHGEENDKELDMSMIERSYGPKLVDFMKFFLRNHLIRQEEFKTQGDYERAVKDSWGYYFLDMTCHELAIGKTFTFSARLKSFEQDPIEIYGVRNAIMKVENNNCELFRFEVDKANYEKFYKKFDGYMNDMICFEFKVTDVIDRNHTQGKILSFK